MKPVLAVQIFGKLAIWLGKATCDSSEPMAKLPISAPMSVVDAAYARNWPAAGTRAEMAVADVDLPINSVIVGLKADLSSRAVKTVIGI